MSNGKRLTKDDLPAITMAQPAVSNQFGVEASREVAQAQAAVIMAKMYPRDPDIAFARIKRACQRPMLAESAIYRYPRGGKLVEGPSIRLAEAIAQNWGNMDTGIKELSRTNGASTLLAYAIDLETNTRKSVMFEVRHVREKQSGDVDLTSDRDIYELAANQGHRRLRACILAVVPGDITEAAVEECNRTMAKVRTGKWEGPKEDRVRQMVAAFSNLGVTKEMIAKYLGHPLDQATDQEFNDLKKIFVTIRDGVTSASEIFGAGETIEAEMVEGSDG